MYSLIYLFHFLSLSCVIGGGGGGLESVLLADDCKLLRHIDGAEYT